MTNLEDAYRDGVVVGLKGVPDAGIAIRQEIDKMLLEQPEAFNLMLIALMELMNMKVPWKIDAGYEVTYKDKFSWFQIAGIHGVPFDPWDGVLNENGMAEKSEDGYCAHSTATFECWHRPYLSMLEQTLYRQIQNIAERFCESTELHEETKEKYNQAAKTFRLPYFDYFRPRDYGRMIPGVTENVIPDTKDEDSKPKEGNKDARTDEDNKDVTPDNDEKPIENPKKDGRNRNTAIMTWLAYDFRLPQIFTMPKIMIKTLPDNELKLMANPLLHYNIPEGSLKEREWDVSGIDKTVPGVKDRTLRYGSASQRSVTWLNDNLNKVREDTLRLTLNFVREYSPSGQDGYQSFGNIASNEISTNTSKIQERESENLVKKPSGSLEAVHNDYHVYLGGFMGSRPEMPKAIKVGHMTCVPVAAFDPVFWFHHAQIDRIFAIWQAVNPNSWFQDLKAKEDQDLQNSSLYPFRSSKGERPKDDRFWTPNSSRNISDFGYTYPDLATNKSPDEIRRSFLEQYEWSMRQLPSDVIGIGEKRPPPEMEPLDLSKAQVFSYEKDSTDEYVFEKLSPHQEIESRSRSQLALASKHDEATHSYEWYIDDAVERMAMNGAFTIFYFVDLNDAISKANGADWVRLPGFVGVTHIFTAPAAACGNCAQQAETKKVVTSTTSMTSLLLDYVETRKLKSMKPEHVKPFLIDNLKWRAQTVTGEVIDPRDLSLKHQFKLSINCMISPLPGKAGNVEFKTYNDIVQTIVHSASRKMDKTMTLT